ncbi:hypothetical protein FIBSPDRAFT_880999 [Athelia psychrophila]|uniref:Uncharacterized protein n=1 Tax=Athelia psychrophila TaxID=1759441 RepID=A0A167SL35_9AGAM|nr:hypothetical protein FIBSPDRAFT_158823 [Fibularhizoctonia sp. CBS 109695]KZP34461.1 hypothetical protein FIBSPDRAFT_880999 [Fibularhizoctonia sp. CBS 109695]
MLPDECDIVDIFAAVLKGIGNGEEDEDDEADQWQRWPKLRTIAVSASGNWDAPAALGNIGILLEACRQPISKLMLPKSLTSQAGIEAVAELRNFVELEDFSVDWATPFLN